MGSSIPRRVLHAVIPGLSLLLAAGVAGCSVGVGEGSATGRVWAPSCGLEGADYALDPSFFAADPRVDGADLLQIRVQRGSDHADVSDGLIVDVTGASAVHDMLGTPIGLGEGPDGLVSMTLYLNATCPFRVGDPDEIPVAYVSTEGTITFESIYAPDAEESTGKEIAATFADVLLVDPSAPEERRATLEGDFRFIFSRGRPAQPFP